jgi:hypothetical protein
MGAHEAGEYLSELLYVQPRYRKQWEHYAKRVRPGAITESGVCMVIAQHIWEEGERPDTETELPRSLRDRIGRALAGQVLTPLTLRWFLDAFDVDDSDGRRLWALLYGSSQIRAITGQANAGASLPIQRRGHHRTLTLHEHHYLGADGLPLRHRTLQVIEVTDGEVDVHPYCFDTNALTVDVLQGGQCEGEAREIAPGIFALDVRLNRVLTPGQTTTLEYATTFRYAEPPPRELRRAASRPIDNVDIRVEFDQARTPSEVWWTIWRDLDGPVVHRERVELDAGNAAERWLPRLQRSVVGFTWDW